MQIHLAMSVGETEIVLRGGSPEQRAELAVKLSALGIRLSTEQPAVPSFESQFLAQLRTVPFPFAIISGPDFVIEYANEAACALAGRRPEEVEGRPALESMPELGGQGLRERLLAVMATRQPWVERELPLRVLRQGMPVTGYFTFTYSALEDHLGRQRVLLCGIDVSDEVRVARGMAEAQRILIDEHLSALRNESRFKSLVAASAAIVWTADARARRFQFLEGWSDFCGLQQKEGTWQEMKEYFHPADWDAIKSAFLAALESGERRELQCRLRRKDGSYAQVISRVAPVRLPTGEIDEWVGAIEDISERHALQEQLKESERLTSLGTLVAGIAHEINNPLSYIISNLRYVLEDWKDGTPELREAMTDALDGAVRAAQIVQDLRLMARQGPQNVVAADVVQALEAALRVAQGEIRQRALLERDVSPLPEVHADPVHLTQVFVNLLMNAAQAIPEGQPDRNRVSVRTFVDAAGRACVRIGDSGGGIPPELRGRIFEPFFTTKEPGKGTGLGLSICHGIVQKLGGEILVESEPGVGTSFTVCLPPEPKT